MITGGDFLIICTDVSPVTFLLVKLNSLNQKI